jgi:hypothetical protein
METPNSLKNITAQEPTNQATPATGLEALAGTLPELSGFGIPPHKVTNTNDSAGEKNTAQSPQLRHQFVSRLGFSLALLGGFVALQALRGALRRKNVADHW